MANNDIALTGKGKQLSTPISPELLRHCERWSLEVTDHRFPKVPTKAQLLAVTTPTSLKGAIASLKDRDRLPTPREMAAHYAMLLVNFPTATMTEEQSRLKFQTFCADLGRIPQRLLAPALERYRLDAPKDMKAKFFPQPWQILVYCEDDMVESRRMHLGLDELAKVIDAPDAPSTEIATPAVAQKYLERAKSVLPPPPPPPKPDFSRCRPETPDTRRELLETLRRRQGQAA